MALDDLKNGLALIAFLHKTGPSTIVTILSATLCTLIGIVHFAHVIILGHEQITIYTPAFELVKRVLVKPMIVQLGPITSFNGATELTQVGFAKIHCKSMKLPQ